MHPRFIAWTLTVALVPAAATTALARSVSFTNNINDTAQILSCSDIGMTFWKDRMGSDDYATARRSQGVALRANPSTPLKVTAANRGGVLVQPSQDGTFSASVCLATGAETMEAAEAILDKLRIESDRGELSVSGPEDEDWAAYIILSVPPATALELKAENGSLTLRDVNGKFTLRTENGPVSLKGVGGVVDAETENGPIDFGGHAGEVRLVTQNGPVSVKLDAAKWIGKGLEGSSQNGPISITAPPGLKSGVLVEGSASSPADWNGVPQPIEGRGSGQRSFRLGDGAVVVKLTTERGPVQVKAPKARSRWVEI